MLEIYHKTLIKHLRSKVVIIVLFFSYVNSWGQVIVSDSFENTSTLFTVASTNYYSGNTGASDGPAKSPQATSGTYGIGANNKTGILTSSEIDVSGCTSPQLSFKLASISISGTGNGADAGDYVRVEISPDGGTTYFNTIEINGNSNAYWPYTASGVASTAYDGNTTPVTFAPAGGGSRTTDGYSSITVTGLPVVANLKIRITLLNNSVNEKWVIDDFVISGTCGAPNTITTGDVSGTIFSLPDCVTSESGSVDFTSSGTFNSGNIYTAQLSNSSGSFTSPIDIGTLASNANTGTVNFTIPVSTPSGTGYLIRIVSSNPSIIGSNSSAFTITLTCVTSLPPGGTVTVCDFSGALSIFGQCNNGQGCTSGCDLTAYGGSGYSMCNGTGKSGDCFEVSGSGVQQIQGITINIPAGCTMSVVAEFKTRGAACPSSGMDKDDYLKLGGTTYSETGNADVKKSITQTSGSISIEISANRSDEILTYTTSIISGSCLQCSLLEFVLVNFTCRAEADGYKLFWTTASEKDSKNFEIEYSDDGLNFSKISYVLAKRQSNSYTMYNKFINNDFYSDVIYFRLKMNNQDGSFTYSPIVYVHNNKFKNNVSITPNPSQSGFISLNFISSLNYNNAIIQIIDLSGSLLYETSVTEDSMAIDVNSFSSGIYILKISSPFISENHKIIIQN